MEVVESEIITEKLASNLEKEKSLDCNLGNNSDLLQTSGNTSSKEDTHESIGKKNADLVQEPNSFGEKNVELYDADSSAAKNKEETEESEKSDIVQKQHFLQEQNTVTCDAVNGSNNGIIETDNIEHKPKNSSVICDNDLQSNNEKINHRTKNRTILSDSDSDLENKKIIKHKPKKRFTFSDSDSESDRKITRKSINNIIASNSDSDYKNEPNIKEIITPRSRKHTTVSDSDSAKSEIISHSRKKITVSNSDSDSNEESKTKVIKHKPRKRITAVSDSDSENENTLLNKKSSKKVKQKKINSKKQNNEENFTLKNSESENELRPHDKSFADDKQENPIYTTNSKGELVLEKSTTKANNWSALCDSESSDEASKDNGILNEMGSEQISDEEVIKPIPYKKKPKSKHDNEPKKMTGKEAVAQRQEIQSESQRMTRESSICLPYHRPKSFTLKEFLARRPKLASAVPVAAKTPPSVAIKMSVEQLEIISKKLEERHKEVKEFYKSDSEADDEDDDDKDDADYVPSDSEKTVENSNLLELEQSADKSSLIPSETGQPEHENDAAKTTDENDDNTINNDNSENLACADVIKFVNDDNLNTAATKEDDTEKQVVNKVNLDTGNNLQDDEAMEVDNETLEVGISADTHSEDNSGERDERIHEIVPTCDIESPVTTQNNDLGSNTCQEEIAVHQNTEDHIPNTKSDKMEEASDEESSMAYQFSLDDLDENSDQVVNAESRKDLVPCEEEISKDRSAEQTEEFSNHSEVNCENKENDLNNTTDSDKQQQDTFDFEELDKEIENFGKDTTLTEPEKPRLSKLELLKEKLANIQPRLSSSRDNVIDLDNVAKPTEVTKLMERFVKHTAVKPHHTKENVKLNVISVESGGEIHKETVAVHVDDDEAITIEEKPGVRLKKLRNELQSQIAQQRAQLWQNKSMKETKNDDDDTYKDEKSECDVNDAILDDDQEEEMSESSEEEIDEDEEDIEDMGEEKPKKRSAFVDDEAEESDIEEEDEDIGTGCDDDVIDNGNNLANEEDNDKETEDEEIEEDDENKENEWKENDNLEQTPFKKPLKRIIKGFAEDSDDDDDIELTSTINKIAEKLSKSNEESGFATQDDYIPPYQIQNQNTPVRNSFTERSDNDLKFLTPVSYITGLQNLTNSTSKLQSPANVPSPLKEVDWHTSLQKKLFADSVITESQAEAMAQLCSEKFPNSQDVPSNTQDNSSEGIAALSKAGGLEDISPSMPPTSQDLLNVCSGDFNEEPSTQELMNVCSEDVTDTQISTHDIPKNSVTHKLNAVEEVKSLGEDQDIIISQLLNEDEFEAFKKKFDSPVLTHSQRVVNDVEEVAATGGILDSDDEDEGILEVKKKKKNQKKLTFSDDESSEEEDEQEEEIDLHDDVDEECPADVHYDSEENEVEYTSEKENQNVKLHDFFEDEAELSESEWGSADEDEKDLDTFEVEQGDAEKFDEKQIRTDLERIHMRRMLDDDTREVKLLQEMLLDDGELHGTGRERQFRWKNIDSLEIGDEEKKNSDDEVCLDEDESEEQWRRKRHEREMFLKEKQSQDINDEDDLLSGSEILKIGQKFLQRSLSNSQGSSSVEKSKTVISSPILKSTFNFVNKRGSFLSRGDQMLQKIAEYNKTTITSEVVVQKTKNSKNFLFQTKEVQEATAKLSIFNNKRKSTDGTPKVIKKLRLTENLSPAVKRKKKPDKSEIRTKLFKVS